jgi:glycosyltransferase involved in cell wall biosynthesis
MANMISLMSSQTQNSPSQTQNSPSQTQKPTVSIVTVTQYSRRHCLANLVGLIKAQIYENIIEWVVVEGSSNAADAEQNAKLIDEQINTMELYPRNIVYIPFRPDQEYARLSDLRNLGNKACIGDIIVCMDDDDYYPPTRVSHAVYMLMNSTALIAGCSKAYIYFYLTHQLFQFQGFGKNHSTNNCMAYKREYLEQHAHKSGLDKAEESSFTNYFSVPMVQLDPLKCIVISGHGDNTVDKSWMCDESSPPGKNRMVYVFEPEEILDLIPGPIFKKMQKMFGI